MIDFIKILNLSSDSTAIEHNTNLADKWVIRSKDGEILEQSAEVFGMTFQIKNNNVKLFGSIHKYYNQGEHNHNDFRFTDINQVVRELCHKYEIEPQNSRLNNVEFGVNVITPIEPKRLLECLISHRGELFTREIEEGKIYYQCKHSQYIVKIYDKGTQYRLVSNLLRFEVKVTKMQFLESKKINLVYLSDLLNKEIYPSLANLLQLTFDEILFDDKSIDLTSLNSTEREVYLRGSNPKTWTENTTRTASQQKELERLRKSFESLLDKHRKGEDYIKTVSELIKVKFLDLSEFYRLSELTQNSIFTSEKIADVGNLHFKYNERFGHLIEQQKTGSRFLSEKTLSQNIDLLEVLKEHRRTNKRKDSSKKEPYYVAHNLRNDESNLRNQLRYKINKLLNVGQLSLFNDLSSTFYLTPKQIEALSFWNGTEYDILSNIVCKVQLSRT